MCLLSWGRRLVMIIIANTYSLDDPMPLGRFVVWDLLRFRPKLHGSKQAFTLATRKSTSIVHLPWDGATRSNPFHKGNNGKF